MGDGDKRKAEAQESGQPAKKGRPSAVKCRPQRVRELKGGAVGEGPIVYWMSRDQRAQDNWALVFAAQTAAKTGAPVAVAFNLVDAYLGAGARQFGFMLRGLRELEDSLQQLRIPFFLLRGDPTETVPALVREAGAAALVTDYAPLRLGRQWRDQVAEKIEVPFFEVDAHNVVPVWEASNKRETGARTIRPKIHRQLPTYLEEFPELPQQPTWNAPRAPQPIEWDKLIAEVLEKGKAVPEVHWVKPGETAAAAALSAFLSKSRLSTYDSKRNDPNAPTALSSLSPYFHFGQLAPQRAAIEAAKCKGTHKAAVESFLEEAVVRRELSDNFCHYEPRYDSIEAAAEWAQETLRVHAGDKREHVYSREQLEKGKTHDSLWNAAQLELVHYGKMHGFMRMYWAKKILEWTASPEQALSDCIYLNDKYELDGRDPNGYVGCMWSICGIHDQGWAERPVFGKIRYMNYAGCKRKFKVEGYVERINKLVSDIKAGRLKQTSKTSGPAIQ